MPALRTIRQHYSLSVKCLPLWLWLFLTECCMLVMLSTYLWLFTILIKRELCQLRSMKRLLSGQVSKDLHHTILYCTLLYYPTLYYTILYYTILFYTILYYTPLYHTIAYRTILYYTVPYYTIAYRTIAILCVVFIINMDIIRIITS